MFSIVVQMMKHFRLYSERLYGINQPFHFYLDSRFSSLQLMKKMNKYGFYYVMTCSSNMKPRKLMTQLKKNLPYRHWRLVHHDEAKATLMCHHVKKKKNLLVVSNYANFRPVETEHRRCIKYPLKIYSTKEPQVINEFNKYMGSVDLFDKMVQTYWRRSKYNNPYQAITSFFVHTCVHNAYIA